MQENEQTCLFNVRGAKCFSPLLAFFLSPLPISLSAHFLPPRRVIVSLLSPSLPRVLSLLAPWRELTAGGI